jgi:hypothetical protein
MQARTALNPEEAKAWGLVHEIKSELFEIGSEVISIEFDQVEQTPSKEKEDER